MALNLRTNRWFKEPATWGDYMTAYHADKPGLQLIRVPNAEAAGVHVMLEETSAEKGAAYRSALERGVTADSARHLVEEWRAIDPRYLEKIRQEYHAEIVQP